jgi:hypothetical protein
MKTLPAPSIRCLKTNKVMFEDRRGRGDRRTKNRGLKQQTDCRRSGERRNILRQYHPQPWWLQTNYVEELQPPVLDNGRDPTQLPSPAK